MRCQEEKQALQTQLTSACGTRDKLKQQLEAIGQEVGESAAALEQAQEANLDLQRKLAAATASRDALQQQTEKQRLQVGTVGDATSCALQLLAPGHRSSACGWGDLIYFVLSQTLPRGQCQQGCFANSKQTGSVCS